MKKYFVISLVVVVIALSLYLYFAYIHIYNLIGEKNLKSPYKENEIVLNNQNVDGYVKYAVLGDSLGAGVGSNNIEETYPYIFAKELTSKYGTVKMINLAYPGDKTIDVIKNQLERVIMENPDYITLMIGTNDLHNHVTEKHFMTNYKIILDTLLNGTDARITVINLPTLGSKKLLYPPFDRVFDYKTKRYNFIISALAQNERVNLVDLYSGVTSISKYSDGYYASDEFHPSGKGYILWSKYIHAN